MTYNMTELQASTTISDLFIYANDSSGGVLVSGLMIALFFVLLMVLKRYEFTNAIVTSSFLCFILSGVLAYGGFMNIMVVLFFLIMTGLGTLYIYVKQ